MPTLKLPGGLELPLTHWAIGWLSVVAILVAAGLGYRQIFPDRQTEAQRLAQVQAEMNEYMKHIGEHPKQVSLLDDARGSLSASVYNDICLLIVGVDSTTGQATTKLVTDLAHGRKAPAHIPARSWFFGLPALAPVVSAATQGPGRCDYNAHMRDQPVRWDRGIRHDQCWVDVVFTFSDGCTYVKLYNECNRTWDAAFRWIRCVH